MPPHSTVHHPNHTCARLARAGVCVSVCARDIDGEEWYAETSLRPSIAGGCAEVGTHGGWRNSALRHEAVIMFFGLYSMQVSEEA